MSVPPRTKVRSGLTSDLLVECRGPTCEHKLDIRHTVAKDTYRRISISWKGSF